MYIYIYIYMYVWWPMTLAEAPLAPGGIRVCAAALAAQRFLYGGHSFWKTHYWLPAFSLHVLIGLG